MSFHVSEPYLPPWGWWEAGVAEDAWWQGSGTWLVWKGWLPCALGPPVRAWRCSKCNCNHFSSDVSMHTFGERGVESFLVGKMRNKNIPPHWVARIKWDHTYPTLSLVPGTQETVNGCGLHNVLSHLYSERLLFLILMISAKLLSKDLKWISFKFRRILRTLDWKAYLHFKISSNTLHEACSQPSI